MILKKGKFNLIINKIGGLDISYRRFTFEIGFFNDVDISLFLFGLFKWNGDAKIFQIFDLEILKFCVSISIDCSKKERKRKKYTCPYSYEFGISTDEYVDCESCKLWGECDEWNRFEK
jgi:hypothetical protein